VAVGERGTILRFDGTRWVGESSGTYRDLLDVWGSGANDIYAVGKQRTIVHYDGGRWKVVHTDKGEPEEAFKGVWSSGPDDVWCVGDRGTIMRFDGVSWRPQLATPNTTFEAIWGRGSDDIYAGGSKGLFHFDGKSWVEERKNNLTALSGNREGMFMVASGATVGFKGAQRWVDWTHSANAAVHEGFDTIFATDDVAFMGGHTLMRSNRPWTSWTRVDHPNARAPRDLHGTATNDVFAVGDQGWVGRYDGSKWRDAWTNLAGLKKDRASEGALVDVWLADNGDLVAIGGVSLLQRRNGVLQRVEHFTLDPRCEPHPSLCNPPNGRAVWGTGPRFMVAAWDSGRVKTFNGNDWVDLPQGSFGFVRDVWAGGPNAIFVVASSTDGSGIDGVFRYDGSVWKKTAIAGATGLAAIWGSDPNKIWVGGTSGVFHFDGSTWSKQTNDVWPVAIWGRSTHEVFASDHGALWRYDGKVWSKMDAPIGGTRIRAPFSNHIVDVTGTGEDLWLTSEGGVVHRLHRGKWTRTVAGSPARAIAARGNEVVIVGPNHQMLTTRVGKQTR